MSDQDKDLGGTPPYPRKRTVVIKLSSREKEDPKAILDAVQAALKPAGIQIRVCEKTGEANDPPEEPPRQALEQLEAKAMSLAGAVLDQKAREISQQDQGTEDASVKAAAVARARKRLLGWIAEKAKAAWQITVVGALDWAKEQVK